MDSLPTIDMNNLSPVIKMIESLQINFNSENMVIDNRYDPIVFDAYFPECNCKRILCTLNTDKPFFGIRVSPIIDFNAISDMINNNNLLSPKSYEVEYDSKLIDFMTGFSANEIALLSIELIKNTIYAPINRESLISYQINNDFVMDEFNHKEYLQLLKYALSDYMYKLGLNTTLMAVYGTAVVSSGPHTTPMFDGAIISIINKFRRKLEYVENFKTDSRPIMLSWLLRIGEDFSRNRSHATYALGKAIKLTGSVLEKNLYDCIIRGLTTDYDMIYATESVNIKYNTSIKPINVYRKNIAELVTRMSVLETSCNESDEYKRAEYIDILFESYNNYKAIERYLVDGNINKGDYRLYKSVLESYDMIKNKAEHKVDIKDTIPIAYY